MMSKTWLVTGSARGLGRHIAEAVLAAGDNVVATARDAGRLSDLQDRYDDHIRVVVLVAGPDEVLFGRERLPVLVDLKLPFGNMADHGILHRRTHGLRSRLNDDVTHRDGLETGNEGWCLTAVSTHHDTWPRRRILVVRSLRCCRFHYGRHRGRQS